jgi:type I restriction-modification system DNA methylase subunit
MALFQSSVIQKELQNLNQTVIDEKWNEFVAHFGNFEIQQKIRGLKEEQYQGEFLDDLFVKVLGYTKPPKPNHNLVTEQKNETNSRKADGAIIVDEKVVGVIELKGTNTTDLEKVKDQAFLYKVNHPECIYVITSNFEKLRFYIENTVDFIEFNLFQLTKKEFSLLYICLSYENIKNNVPKHLKDESVSKENQITKQLYKDYSDFKRALYNNLVELNPQYDKLLLFKKTQKLLDRFLFIFFAEDRQLVPTNLIRRINLEWEDIVKVKRINVSLYDRYKTYFDDLNAGAKVTLPAFGKKTGDAITAQFEIFAYNGGLFAPDDVLDNVRIDDALLHKHSILLSDYDFESDVDVNILGHIFENSLNEIDEIKSEIEGQLIDKTKTKRKKDGVFYTPKYITKYIIDNTVGKLCFEKKTELNIVDEDYTNDKKIQTKTKKAHLDKLTEYRNWLLQLTICDPACGSGAFLNQALEFLIAEHRYVDELQAKLMGDSLVLSDVEKSILENNIYGVDLNDESVEIAKLSLWLRTAQKGRKLNSLNNNIKCGNSLIDDPLVAGEKAFNWQHEFPTVFEKSSAEPGRSSGFDVVIGNPPYGAKLDNKDWLKEKFKKTSFGNIDSYKYFVELGINLVRHEGVLSFIMPDSYLEKEYFKDLRILTSNNFRNIRNIKLGDDVFEEVNLPTAIIILSNKGYLCDNFEYLDIQNFKANEKQISLFNSNNFITKNPDYETSFVVINSIIKSKNIIPLIEVYDQVMGVKVYQIGKGKPKQTKDEIENDVFVSNHFDAKYNYQFISQGIGRYEYSTQNEFISYGEWLAEPRKKEYFDNPKIVIREIINPRIFATFIYEKAVVKNIAAVIIEKNKNYNIKFLLGLMNSKLISFYVNEQSPKSNNKSYPSFNSRLLKNIPIPKTNPTNQNHIIEKADLMLQLNNDLKEQNRKFITLLKSDFKIEKPSKKTEEFYTLTWSEFEKELSKNKITLLGIQKDDWLDRFERLKKQALDIKNQIDQTDKEIDRMVYELYGLTDEEIQIVENS